MVKGLGFWRRLRTSVFHVCSLVEESGDATSGCDSHFHVGVLCGVVNTFLCWLRTVACSFVSLFVALSSVVLSWCVLVGAVWYCPVIVVVIVMVVEVIVLQGNECGVMGGEMTLTRGETLGCVDADSEAWSDERN